MRLTDNPCGTAPRYVVTFTATEQDPTETADNPEPPPNEFGVLLCETCTSTARRIATHDLAPIGPHQISEVRHATPTELT